MSARIRSCLLFAELTALAFTFAQMESAALTTLFVATNGNGNGSSWAEATNSIQDAISAIDTGNPTNTVWVSNGVYEVGGVINWPTGTVLTNRVAITNAITVRSANNDPTNTIIKGAWNATTTNGWGAVRCVYMANNSSLIGFTVTNGATLTTNESAVANDRYGGGILCQSINTMISNCVIAGNSAARNGGGAAWGTLRDCTLTRNWAGYGGGGSFSGVLYNCMIVTNIGVTYGGGTYYSDVYNSTIISNWAGNGGGTAQGTIYNSTIVRNRASSVGGGALWGVVSNCTLIGNSTADSGGGAAYLTMYNCTIVSNRATSWGGGALLTIASSLYNCTIVGNYAYAGGGGGVQGGILYNCTIVGNSTLGSGGGIYNGILYNCIVYFNHASTSGSNWTSTVSFTNSCTTPSNSAGWAAGNITNDPAFFTNGSGFGLTHVAGNYHLRADSPCVNAGINQSWMTGAVDLDGRMRIRYGTVDMGAYERLHKGTVCGVH